MRRSTPVRDSETAAGKRHTRAGKTLQQTVPAIGTWIQQPPSRSESAPEVWVYRFVNRLEFPQLLGKTTKLGRSRKEGNKSEN
jgi:hypothetical protein